MNKIKASKDNPLVLGKNMPEDSIKRFVPHVKLPFEADNFKSSKDPGVMPAAANLKRNPRKEGPAEKKEVVKPKSKKFKLKLKR